MDIKLILLVTAVIMYLGCGLGNCMFLGSLGCRLNTKVALHTIFAVPYKAFIKSLEVLPEISHKISYSYFMENSDKNMKGN